MSLPKPIQERIDNCHAAGGIELDLSWIARSDPAGLSQALEAAASYFPGLTTLSLQFNRMGPEGARVLVNRLPAGLTTLEMEFNRIGLDGVRALADKLPSGLTTLRLLDNMIGPDGARALADKLPTGLTTLELGNNSIGPDGARALADWLPAGLTTLELGNNSIGPDGAQALADRLPAGLRVLNLGNNSIGPDGAQALADRLPAGLRVLNLGNNSIGLDGAQALADRLPAGLRVLNLENNSIGSDGAQTLAEKLPAGLKMLVLCANNVGPDGAQALAERWRYGFLPALGMIMLDGNDIGVDDAVLSTSSPDQIFGALLRGRVVHEARIVVLGNPEAGKTWLCERVFLDRRPGPRQPGGTPDFDVHRSVWSPRINDVQEIALNVWDFGGHFILHGVHEMFLTHRSIPLLILDVGKTLAENDVQYWLRMIGHFLGPATPILIVVSQNLRHGRKKRLETAQLVEAELQSANRLSGSIRIVDNFDVDSQLGIENLKSQIAEMLTQMEDLQNKVSQLQYRVKQRSEREFNPTDPQVHRPALIPLSEFRTWCDEETAQEQQASAMAESSDPDALLRIVHNFGSLFYFWPTSTERDRFTPQRSPAGLRGAPDEDGPPLPEDVSPGQVHWLKQRKDSILEEWLIHPHWLKWPLYHITKASEQRDAQGNDRQGKLTDIEIDEILAQNPATNFDVRPQGTPLVKAMLALTELCHFSDADQTYLFPRGLSRNGTTCRPDWYDENAPADHVLDWFFYPESAFHRLIVRWFEKIHQNRAWRYGMEVREHGVHALVQGDREAGRITIHLHDGDEHARNILYHGLRRDLIEFIGRKPAEKHHEGQQEIKMNKGQAAKKLADAIIDALDDNEDKLKAAFTEAGLRYTDYEGSPRNRMFRAVTGGEIDKVRLLVQATIQERPDHRPGLEQLLDQFLSTANQPDQPSKSLPQPADQPGVIQSRAGFSGKARNEFNQRLAESWHDLANQINIPDHVRATWSTACEADEIWKWLDSRQRLGELPDTLVTIDRKDLYDLLRNNGDSKDSTNRTRDLPPVQDATPVNSSRGKMDDPEVRKRLVRVILTISGDLANWTEEDQTLLLKSIRELSGMEGDVQVIGTEIGNIRLVIELSEHDASLVLEAVLNGALAEYHVHTAATDDRSVTSSLPEDPHHVVLIMHGIRDVSGWQARAAGLLKTQGLLGIPVTFGYYDIVSFLSPFSSGDSAYETFLSQFTRAREKYPHAKLSIVAHSFGTYLVGRLLREHPDPRICRIILCGSVLLEQFDWSEYSNGYGVGARTKPAVLNECGSTDVLPVLAHIGSSCYGAAGRYGFEQYADVVQRWFVGGHSVFLKRWHIENIWGPFLKDGKEPDGTSTRPSLSWCERILDTVPRSRLFLRCLVVTPIWMLLRWSWVVLSAVLIAGIIWFATPPAPDYATSVSKAFGRDAGAVDSQVFATLEDRYKTDVYLLLIGPFSQSLQDAEFLVRCSESTAKLEVRGAIEDGETGALAGNLVVIPPGTASENVRIYSEAGRIDKGQRLRLLIGVKWPGSRPDFTPDQVASMIQLERTK